MYSKTQTLIVCLLAAIVLLPHLALADPPILINPSSGGYSHYCRVDIDKGQGVQIIRYAIREKGEPEPSEHQYVRYYGPFILEGPGRFTVYAYGQKRDGSLTHIQKASYRITGH
jgi:hypothetical protein